MGHLSNEHMDSFRLAMAEAGVRFVGPLDADGKFRRIHVEGDRKGSRNGWYVLHADGVPAGAFGTNKGDLRLTWKATAGVKPLTREERKSLAEEAARKKAEKAAAEAALQAEAARRAVEMWDQAADAADHPYLARKGVPGYGLKVGVWIKESPPDPDTGEIRTTRIKNALLVPIRDRKTIVSLQAIFASRVGDRDKDFVYGGRKRGCWFAIGKPTEVYGVPTFVICEGYATGASIHRATGMGVVVAFDAGNLLPVAETVHGLMPDARILIAGDHDRFTTNAKGEPWNPGAEKAQAAAEAVGGRWVLPTFADLSSKPTDFNDLDALDGVGEVRRQIMEAMSPGVERSVEPDIEPDYFPETDPDNFREIQDVPAEFEPDAAAPEEPAAEAPTKKRRKKKEESNPRSPDEHADVDASVFFTIRGHDDDQIHVSQHEGQMIISRGFAEWSSEAALVTIAPLWWWENIFRAPTGFDRKAAHDWLVRTAYEKGFWDAKENCRGRGAWIDDGRIVFHCGDHLIVDGVRTAIPHLKSNFVYAQGHKWSPPADEPMSSADGRRIIEMAQKFNWTRPASAVLLAGWAAIAPLCGALRWRPHIWITGGAGSGKTTILNDFLHPLMAGTEVYAQGNSTEAGIRQTVKYDACPVLVDEGEQNNESEEGRMQNLISLFRQASSKSGARTIKGSVSGDAISYRPTVCGCISSIQVGIKHQADLERITRLALRSKKSGALDGVQASDEWTRLSAALFDLQADRDLPARLLRRTLELLPTTLENIKVFAQAAAQKFGSQREGDQFGTMLAGAWSLVSRKLVTLDEARAMIERYDWSEYTEDSETEESSKALGALLGSKLRVKNGMEVTVYEVVAAAAGLPAPDSYDADRKEADAVLRRHGMAIKWVRNRPEDSALLVSYGSFEVKKLMERTPYAADIKGQLERVPGAFKEGMRSFNGTKKRSTGLPLAEFLDSLRPAEPGAFEVDDNIVF